MLRQDYLTQLHDSFKYSKVITLLGPRQCGKTTLARQFFNENHAESINYFDLENPIDLARLQEPILALQPLCGLIVIDEIQRVPELFPILRVLVDEPNNQKKFLILGSASRQLIQQSSESLAGRINCIELTPFSFEEVDGSLEKIWLRGGYPLAYLAENDSISSNWRKAYIRSFLEQDLPNLGIDILPENLRRFWLMLTHYHGQIFNASEIGKSLGLSHNTTKKYLDILISTFMVRRLAPWYENITKRQVKTPKIYFRDSGLLHSLLNINDMNELRINPKLGALWEGFALESVIRHLHVDSQDCYFWATHNQAELDLFIVEGLRRRGFEFKYTQAPKLTPSIKIALEALKPEKITVIYPGNKRYFLHEKVECVGLKEFLSL